MYLPLRQPMRHWNIPRATPRREPDTSTKISICHTNHVTGAKNKLVNNSSSIYDMYGIILPLRHSTYDSIAQPQTELTRRVLWNHHRYSPSRDGCWHGARRGLYPAVCSPSMHSSMATFIGYCLMSATLYPPSYMSMTMPFSFSHRSWFQKLSCRRSTRTS